MSKALKILVGILVIAAFASVTQASTVTNRGQVITVNTLTDDGPLGDTTVTKDLSVRPSQDDRRGLYVATYDFSVDGGAASTSIDISPENLLQGTILLENAVVEVSTAILPATSTNTVAVGGVDIIAVGTTLNSTGIKAGVATAGITTSADKIYLTIGAVAATSGVFTVYCPVILGNAQGN